MRFGSPYTIQPDYEDELENVFIAEVYKINEKEIEKPKRKYTKKKVDDVEEKPKAKRRGRPKKEK